MSDEREDIYEEDDEVAGQIPEAGECEPAADGRISGKYARLIREGENRYRIAGMYKNWFLDYASYVILDRAVPHLEDGLKPVQRRILHTMRTMHDGRYSKVANIVGQTMKFHPHGDASIKDALVQMGQKNLLIDCQGNWGNIITGDEAAAGRYIEARLSNFAVDVVFNPKTTEWMNSYDGRDKEPVTLPVKFPLVLQQGADGIAVGLNCKILPHNFNELIDASIAYLKGESFTLYPDFPLGGIMDVSRYNDGKRGGTIKVRAKIVKTDKRTIEITELPYGKSSDDIKKSIIAAAEKNKIKVRRVDDESSGTPDIVITLHADVSPDKTIDALYAFTDCEISISPNTCVIKDNKPQFLTVTEVLAASTERTRELLRKELEIKLRELEETWHYLSLEKIFFEEKKYRLLEKDSKNWDAQVQEIHKELRAYEEYLHQPVTMDDVQKLVEKPVRKISKFDVKECNTKIAKVEADIRGVRKDLGNVTKVAIDYFTALKKKYGADYPRRTEIASLEVIQAAKVAVSNAKLYVDRAEGFIGTDQKKVGANAELVCSCSDIDDIIVFLSDGKYMVTKVTEKSFVGKNIIHAGVFVKNNVRTIYNVVYRDGKGGNFYAKRFAVPSVTRDKEYDLTAGAPDSKVMWFTSNPNGEAEIIRIHLRPKTKLKKLVFEYDFAALGVKGRASRGNLMTKNPISRIQLKAKGVSTIGDKPIWFDSDICRLNEDNHGLYLGKFREDDMILVIYRNGSYCTTNFDLNNHYDGDILRIEKMKPHKVFAALYFDGESRKFYLKRFKFEVNGNPANLFISDAPESCLVALTDKAGAAAEVVFGGRHEGRGSEIIAIDGFISEKGWKAKGKRLSQYDIESVSIIEPQTAEEEDESAESGNVGEGGAVYGAHDDIAADMPDADDMPAGDDIPEWYGGNYSAGDFIDMGGDEDEPTLF